MATVSALSQAQAIIQINVYSLSFLDTFSRTTSAPPFNVGTSDSGSLWHWTGWDSLSGQESLSAVHVDGSALVLENAGPNSSTYDSLYNSAATTGNSTGEFLIDIYLPSTGQVSQFYWNDRNWYISYYYSVSNVIRLLGSSGSGPTISVTPSSWYRLRVIIDPSGPGGVYVKAHIWKIGDTEPVGWTTIQGSWPVSTLGAYPEAILDIYNTPSNEASKFDNVTVYSTRYSVFNQSFGQTQARILATSNIFAQALSTVNQVQQTGQANSRTLQVYSAPSQSLGFIRKAAGYGQAIARIAFSSGDYGYVIQQDSANSYWPLDDADPSSFINKDYISTQQLTSFSGSTSVPGINSRARLATRPIDYIYAIGTGLTRFQSTQWAIDGWAKFALGTAQRQPVFGFLSSSSEYMSIGQGGGTSSPINGTNIIVFHYDGAVGRVYNSGITVSAGKWYHIALTYDNRVFTIYIDGVQTTQWNSSNPFVTSTFYLCRDPFSGTGTSTPPDLDGVASYDFVLTQTQITNHAIAGNTQAYGQARVQIGGFRYGQSTALIDSPLKQQPGQALTSIKRTSRGSAQARAEILTTTRQVAQVQAWIIPPTVIAQAQAYIKLLNQSNFGQAQGYITSTTVMAQAQALIQHFTAELGTINSFGSNIIPAFGYESPKYLSAQAQVYIRSFNQPNFGQTQAYIKATYQEYGQAQTYIGHFQFGQTQAFILKLKGLGQAQTTIDTHTRYSDTVIRDGAIAYWRLNEANGTTARDFIGTLDGIYTGSPALNQSGPPLISGALSVLLTDSDSVFVDTPTPTGLPSGNSDRTIEAWYKSSSANADVIFGYGNNNTREQFVVVLNYNGNIAVSAYNEDPGFTVTGFNDGNWHYLAATYTGSSRVLEIWFDGISKGTYTFSNNLNTVLTGSDIGRLYYANGFAFNGNLSNIAVYPTALNAAAIFSHSIGGILLGNGQAQTFINAIQYRPAQAQAYVSPAFNQPNFGQAQAKINAFGVQNFGQSQTYIGHYQFAQAQVKINAFNYPQFGQALSVVKAFNVNQTGQAQAFTLSGLRVTGQAQTYIGHFQFGQAQAYIGHYQFGQAQARMLRTYNIFGQANAQVGHQAFAQAQSRIISFNVPAVGQSLAFIRKSAGYANVQARIIAFNIPNYGQSQGYIKKLLGTANAQATIRHIYYGFAQANAYNLGPFWVGQAQTGVKQTYPVIGMDTNYALVVNGASASDSTGQLFAPTNVIDGNDYGPDWSIGTGLNQTLNIDLGQARLINFYRILPIRYDCTVNLQYSLDNVTWSNVVIGIQFAVGFFGGVDTSKVVTGQIGSITARYWRLYVTDGGSNGGAAILSFELGIASVKSPTFAQAQAFIGHMTLGQSMAYVSPGRGSVNGQTQAQIVITVQRFALSKAWIIPPTMVGQSIASILQTYRKSAQVSAWVIPPTVIAQALATIKAYDVEGVAQATGDIKAILFRRANTQAFITKPIGIAQVQAQIKSSRSWSFGQSRVSIGHFTYSQVQAFIAKTQGAGQVMAQIKRTQPPKVAQAQASVVHLKGYAQVTADIKSVQQVYGNASALLNQAFGLSSVQTTILHTYYGFGQTNTSIKNIATNYSNPYGQAQAMVFITYYVSAQVIAWISVRHTPIGQAMAFIRSFKYGQAQAKLNAYNYPRHAQAQAYIAVNLSITVATPNSESHSYLVRYNNYDLPGYAQDESYDSTVTITPHPAMGVDGSLSEYLGLTNKSASIRMRAWEPTYLLVKEKVQKAAVMLSSFRGGFAKLYVQQPNAYFLAMVKKIAVQKDAKSSGKILDYIVDFETMPWLISNDTYEISGTGLIDTGSRTISDGGWTPTKILVSGTDVTITAYTETNNYSAGSIAITGLCTNLVIDSENFTAIENGVNKNGSITTKDYAIHVGPGKTFFQINGATSCIIQYNNRWYLSSTKKISTQTIATTVLPASIIQSQYGQTGALISSGTKQSYAQVRTIINDPVKRTVATAQALLTSPITSVSGNAGGVLRNGRSWSFAQAQAGVLLPNVEGLGQAKALVEGATKYKSGQASAITTQPKRLVLGSARAVIY